MKFPWTRFDSKPAPIVLPKLVLSPVRTWVMEVTVTARRRDEPATSFLFTDTVNEPQFFHRWWQMQWSSDGLMRFDTGEWPQRDCESMILAARDIITLETKILAVLVDGVEIERDETEKT